MGGMKLGGVACTGLGSVLKSLKRTLILVLIFSGSAVALKMILAYDVHQFIWRNLKIVPTWVYVMSGAAFLLICISGCLFMKLLLGQVGKARLE